METKVDIDADLELNLTQRLCSIIYDEQERENYAKSIQHMQRRGHWLPAYHSRFEGVVDGVHKIVERVELFTPIQLRSITAAPWPECANRRNCQRLIENWNRVPGYTYKLV